MKKKINIPGWLFLPAVAAFSESVIHFWNMSDFLAGRYAAVLLFALGFGSLLGFLVSLLPNGKAVKWTTVALAALIGVACLVEHFINDAYRGYMPLISVLSGAKGVATDFSDQVVDLVMGNLWRIGVMLLPTVLYAIFAESRTCAWKGRGAMAAAAVGLYLLGFGTVHLVKTDIARFTTSYNFDSATRVFGLNMSLVLDAIQGNKAEEEVSFVIPETVAPPAEETTAPAESEPVETLPPETEPPVVYEPNVLDLDFGQLAQEETNGTIATIHQYVDSLEPSLKNEYTGLFAGKNLIFITAEAFAAEVIDPELTPTLYRLANEGIKFTDYYQPMWGGSTITGEFANLTGLVACAGTESMLEGVNDDLFFTIGNQLQDQGYFSAAYHNHLYTYYKRHKSHVHMGYDTFMGMANGMEEGVKEQWPQSDLEMFEFTVPQYIDQQPFSIYYMTVSGHCGYNNFGGNKMSTKHYEEVAHLECSETVKCYFAAQLELEYAMEHLVNQLEEAGIADDTVIVISTDHYPYGLENSAAWGNTRDYVTELYGYKYQNKAERDHNALIIWSGCIEDMDLQVDTPTYSLDILPTLSNLFGVEYDSRLLVGRDVFSDTEPIVLWYDYTWVTEKGIYDSETGTFTPREGVEVEEGYLERIHNIVSNKIYYSRVAQQNNYFNYVSEARNPEQPEQPEQP